MRQGTDKRIELGTPALNMVTLEEIRRKAEALYPKAIGAWLRGDDSFFPYRLKVSVQRDSDYHVARQAQVKLIEHSKASGKPSYSLIFREISSRAHGKQNFISGVVFESFPDLVGFAGKSTEFKVLSRAVNQLDRELPELKAWQAEGWRKLLTYSAELNELIEFAQYMRHHPMPGCHIRELPLAISTKTIQRCESLMAQWLEIVLPPMAKDPSATSFAERFGFEVAPDHFRLRVLDDELLTTYALPCPELSLPVEMLSSLPVENSVIIIVENKVNLSKLPAMRRTIALGGLGFGIVRLFNIPWLQFNRLLYWGDIDVEGLEILAQVRQRFPHVESVLMDSETLRFCDSLTIRGNLNAARSAPSQLTVQEQQIYRLCSEHSLRLEQERIPRDYVRQVLSCCVQEGA